MRPSSASRNSRPKNLKLVQTDAADEKNVIDVVFRTVKKEARVVKGSATDYELAQFTYAHTLAHTSSTLLTLVSELVSDGKVSKKSISLSQAIQTHITGARNQTTLGLAVKTASPPRKFRAHQRLASAWFCCVIR